MKWLKQNVGAPCCERRWDLKSSRFMRLRSLCPSKNVSPSVNLQPADPTAWPPSYGGPTAFALTNHLQVKRAEFLRIVCSDLTDKAKEFHLGFRSLSPTETSRETSGEHVQNCRSLCGSGRSSHISLYNLFTTPRKGIILI